MAEPASTTSTGLAAIIVTLLGPMFGEYAVIVLASLAGASWSMGAAQTPRRRDGALFLLRIVGTASFLTSSIAYACESKLQIPAVHLLAPVAFGIGAIGDRWSDLITAAFGRLRNLVKGGQ